MSTISGGSIVGDPPQDHSDDHGDDIEATPATCALVAAAASKRKRRRDAQRQRRQHDRGRIALLRQQREDPSALAQEDEPVGPVGLEQEAEDMVEVGQQAETLKRSQLWHFFSHAFSRLSMPADSGDPTETTVLGKRARTDVDDDIRENVSSTSPVAADAVDSESDSDATGEDEALAQRRRADVAIGARRQRTEVEEEEERQSLVADTAQRLFAGLDASEVPGFVRAGIMDETATAALEQEPKQEQEEEEEEEEAEGGLAVDGSAGDDERDNAEDSGAALHPMGVRKLPRKLRKQQQANMLVRLKQLAPRPDLVEMLDTTAPDPELFVFLKSSPFTVPVPRHWSSKRKYLDGKRGVEKNPYRLPDYIDATGIQKLRDALAAEESSQSARKQAQARLRPKMGKMSVDYEILFDAFFRHQKKPCNLSKFGDIYYEGRESERSFSSETNPFRPGAMSERLQRALGMLPPPGAEKSAGGGPPAPPPFLFAMQRLGPPPAYPRMAVSGVNAPLPRGAVYGTQAGAWGQPPPLGLDGLPIWGGDPYGKSSSFASSSSSASLDVSRMRPPTRPEPGLTSQRTGNQLAK